MRPPHWYALYTKSRAEKKALKELQDAGIKVYLPLKTTLKQWSDRKKKVEVPIINCYIFVNLIPKHKEAVFAISDHLLAYVKFNNEPAIIRDHEMEAFRRIVEGGVDFSLDTTKYAPGQKVKITHGNLKGLKGELVEIASNRRFIINIEQIGYSLTVNIPPQYLTAL
ncbi:MAG: UpxY family transcription antiterminator [Bacteroidales bacterium]|nr:UpxY family transcription antiterminator [Bacteroidales bacterium]